ncbi:hypothetical protein CI238_06113 [Colletotrichum incanum]|uniref:Uncharacterized protein n=1 Tax=Colletotrichum incanum TaxID=1573173 RepID=A0A167C2F9_COLIC|nr:hypothetical protein CI238_06113 [Colletotrichum incanum]
MRTGPSEAKGTYIVLCMVHYLAPLGQEIPLRINHRRRDPRSVGRSNTRCRDVRGIRAPPQIGAAHCGLNLWLELLLLGATCLQINDKRRLQQRAIHETTAFHKYTRRRSVQSKVRFQVDRRDGQKNKSRHCHHGRAQ